MAESGSWNWWTIDESGSQDGAGIDRLLDKDDHHHKVGRHRQRHHGHGHERDADFRTRIYQQGVTLVARLAKGEDGEYPVWYNNPEPTMSSNGAATGWRVGAWRVPAEQMPIIIGVTCGGLLLIAILVAAFVWRCCLASKRIKLNDEKTLTAAPSPASVGSVPVMQNRKALFLIANKNGNGQQWTYSSRLASGDDTSIGDGPTDSLSRHMPHCQHYKNDNSQSSNKEHLSQPLQFSPCDISVSPTGWLAYQGSSDATANLLTPANSGGYQIDSSYNQTAVPLTHVPLYYAATANPELLNQYASSSVLEEVVNGSSSPYARIIRPGISDEANGVVAANGGSGALLGGDFDLDPALKTRSLPAWVRGKHQQRPLSTEDDLNQLYDKVSFSKKRKNRMRPDAAAIIAMSKSRSQFLSNSNSTTASPSVSASDIAPTSSASALPFPLRLPLHLVSNFANNNGPSGSSNKDTDSLMDNEEAVIVYDERTAL